MNSNKLRIVAAAGSGLMLTGAFPAVNLSVLAWVALLPLLWAIGGMSAGGGFRLGFIAGLTHYLTLMYWLAYTMTTYGGLPGFMAGPILFLLAAYLSLFPAVFAGLVAFCRLAPLSALCLIPAAWAGLEFLRSFVFSGFPWGFLGHSQFTHLALIQMADIFGVYGVSFLIVAVNVGILLAGRFLTGPRQGNPPVSGKTALTATALLAAAFVAAFGYGYTRIHSIDALSAAADTRTIAAVQGNIAQDIKWHPGFARATVEKYLRLSSVFKNTRTDLIVWPESATPFYLTRDPGFTGMVLAGIQTIGTDFLVGSPSFSDNNGKRRYHNSAYLIDRTGHPLDRCDKAHLVPFGEYVPFKRYLPFIGKIVAQVGDFVPGPVGDTIAWGDHRIGVLICYELIFPNLARRQVLNGASLLVNLTNDAWYGRTSGPYQHFAMAVFRAIETRRALVRAANTGISGFIDPVGRIDKSTPLYTATAIRQAVPLLSIETPYVRAGDLFAAACLAIWGLWAGRRFIGRSRSRRQRNGKSA